MEEAPRLGRDEVERDRRPARRFSHQDDVGGVAAEGGDVGADPAQCEPLIREAVAARRAVGGSRPKRIGAEEAKRAEPAVRCDEHHIIRKGPVGLSVGARAVVELAGVQVDDHRVRRARRRRCAFDGCWRHHVEVQAVLGCPRPILNRGPSAISRLDARAAKVHGISHARPRAERHRRAPPQLTQGWFGIRDAAEGTQLPRRVHEATQPARRRGDQRALQRRRTR